jgi:MoaA/NifB/PqqE/SkfB family radical SAM enzyme
MRRGFDAAGETIEVHRLTSELKLAGLGLTALKSNFVQLKHPYKLNFAVTYRCQSRCQSCSIWKQKPKQELSLDEIEQFAEKNNHFRWLGLTGGEPFLRSDLVDVVEAFVQHSKGLYLVAMPTNSLSSEDIIADRIASIFELGVPRIIITLSLDGYRKLNDRVRGVNGSFDKVMSMARRLRSMQKTWKGLSFSFGYTISKLNEGSLEQTYQAVKKEISDVTYNDFHINMGQVSGIYYDNLGADIQTDRLALADELDSFIRKRHMEFGVAPLIEGVFLKKLVYYMRTGRQPIRSRSLDASLFLTSDGDVYPSIMWDRKLGNVRDTGYDLEPIWHGKEAQAIRSLIKQGKEPSSWTACEAYQSITGYLPSLL